MKFELGQKVHATGNMVRTCKGWGRTWEEGLPISVDGFVVGHRTYMNGNVDSDYDAGYWWAPDPGSAFPAYLVAFDIRRKPMVCKEEQLCGID